MQIVIPMTGNGSRFVAAGYQDLKPFIKVQGRPIIEWIVQGMYTPDDEFIFVCRGQHFRERPWMKDCLMALAPCTKVVAIDDWVKKGPVFDVLRAAKAIDMDKPVIINYCDFYMIWDWQKFQEKVAENGCHGAVPCYTGFHPNLIPAKNLYASCRTDDEDCLLEIREKYSFEADKFKAKHSPGVYYFKSGHIMVKYCQKLVNSNQSINGEFYASLPYNFMVQDGLRVWIPCNVQWFCQWGTPEDMYEYLFWTEQCRRWSRA